MFSPAVEQSVVEEWGVSRQDTWEVAPVTKVTPSTGDVTGAIYKRVFLNSCLIAHLLTTDINRMEWYGFPLPSLPRGRQRQVLVDWLFWECYECTCMWKNCLTAGNPL